MSQTPLRRIIGFKSLTKQPKIKGQNKKTGREFPAWDNPNRIPDPLFREG
jgi:hypothetical protein